MPWRELLGHIRYAREEAAERKAADVAAGDDFPDTDGEVETDADGDPVIRLSPPPTPKQLEKIPWEHDIVPRAPLR